MKVREVIIALLECPMDADVAVLTDHSSTKLTNVSRTYSGKETIYFDLEHELELKVE